LDVCDRIARALIDPLLFTFKSKNRNPLDDRGRKAGRQYLNSLSRYRRELESLQASPETLAAIDQLIERVEVTLQPAPKHSQTWHKMARPLARLARWGWKTTGGAIPRGQPVCKWVTYAMEAMGWKVAEATVNEVLRLRHTRRRSNQQTKRVTQ
jgi:hypothetical protein